MVGAGRPFVVVVEDHADSREVFAECLRIGGFDVGDFACAEDALASFVGRPPHAVVTDLTLPGMTGEEFVLKLRAEPKLATIPVFALSGRPLESRVSSLFACTLLKPVDLERLTAALKGALSSVPTREG